MSDHKLEETVRELVKLGQTRPLPTEKMDAVKNLMKRLREAGFTNREISDLTGGAWSESSAKSYTKGTEVKSRNTKKRATEVVTELVGRNLTLDDVEQTLTIRDCVKARGLSFEEVPAFLEEIRKNKVALRDLLDFYQGLKKSGITFNQLIEQLSFKSELDRLGVTLDGLKVVV